MPKEIIFNKEKVKHNFSRSSSSYNSHAVLQKIVAKNLFDLAKNDIQNANNIIDLGAGTGFISENILKEFNNKNIAQLDISEKMLLQNPFSTQKIIADIENLPEFEQKFDLALSSLTMQWVNDLEKAIKSVLNILNDKKTFHFSIVGEKTLSELRESVKQCNIEISVNDFVTEYRLNEILTRQKLNFTIKSEIITLKYKDCYELLNSIKSIGASYNQNKKPISRANFETLNNFYLKNFNSDNMIASSWQIFYVAIN